MKGKGLSGEADSYAATKLEEIVVTARQRTESIQDIPLAVTAFTSEDFERQATQSLSDGDIENISEAGQVNCVQTSVPQASAGSRIRPQAA